jgi:hypothetical protein
MSPTWKEIYKIPRKNWNGLVDIASDADKAYKERWKFKCSLI